MPDSRPTADALPPVHIAEGALQPRASRPKRRDGGVIQEVVMKAKNDSLSRIVSRLCLFAGFCCPVITMAAYAGAASSSAQDELAVVAKSDAFAGDDRSSGSGEAVQMASVLSPEQAVMTDTDALVKSADTFGKESGELPINENFRRLGALAMADSRWERAAKMFRLAARYADKYSQHRLSMLYWHGIGVPKDRVEAYLWADIAAERGYPQMLAVRESMWRELTPAQQAEVPVRGVARYAEFGDAVAKRRLATELYRTKYGMTGSHTGFDGGVGVRLNGFTCKEKCVGTPRVNSVFEMLADSDILRPERHDPRRYWTHEDRAWKLGTVEVGELEEVDRGAAKPEPPKP
jgi:uncharacterized protein